MRDITPEDRALVIRFGVFEADLRTGELRREGRLIRLQQQPFEVLRVLLLNAGDVVTRDEFKRSLWPGGVTVEFDPSLNKSLTKLRTALGDSVASPRFIETLPKRGYRFIAPVAVVPPRPEAPPLPHAAVRAADRPAATVTHFVWFSGRHLAMIGVAALLAVSIGAARRVPEGMNLAASERDPAPPSGAQEAYDRGRVALARRSEDGLRAALDHFRSAIAVSPRYADAYAGLADAWSLLASYGLEDPWEAMPRARDAANRALTLDPSLAHAHASLARTAMIFDWDWRTAEWHFRRALALQPGAAKTHQWFAYFYSALGRHDEAIASARRALAADPLSPNTNTALGYVLYVARRDDEALEQLTRTLAIDPDFSQARRNLALTLAQRGELPRAIVEFERVLARNPDGSLPRAELAWALGRSGRRQEALRLVSELEAKQLSAYVPADSLALAHLGAGQRDQAVAWLQRAFTQRLATMVHLGTEPMWEEIRGDTRVAQLIEQIRAGAAVAPAF